MKKYLKFLEAIDGLDYDVIQDSENVFVTITQQSVSKTFTGLDLINLNSFEPLTELKEEENKKVSITFYFNKQDKDNEDSEEMLDFINITCPKIGT